jgi:two-component system cell cycle sensor histidine kinase/response regulator CckA
VENQVGNPPHVFLQHLVEAAAHAAWQAGPGRALEFVGPKDPVWVQAEPSHVGRIMRELVTNAVDAIGEKGRIRVSVEQVRFEVDQSLAHRQFEGVIATGRYAKVSVVDNGPGVPPEIKHKLFEPFVSTKPPAVGRGLGLATVYGIAKALGWYVDVESEAGHTVFGVYIPSTGAPETEP